jgi:hypothetical protein
MDFDLLFEVAASGTPMNLEFFPSPTRDRQPLATLIANSIFQNLMHRVQLGNCQDFRQVDPPLVNYLSLSRCSNGRRPWRKWA